LSHRDELPIAASVGDRLGLVLLGAIPNVGMLAGWAITRHPFFPAVGGVIVALVTLAFRTTRRHFWLGDDGFVIRTGRYERFVRLDAVRAVERVPTPDRVGRSSPRIVLESGEAIEVLPRAVAPVDEIEAMDALVARLMAGHDGGTAQKAAPVPANLPRNARELRAWQPPSGDRAPFRGGVDREALLAVAALHR
jgi:hypothetical protein